MVLLQGLSPFFMRYCGLVLKVFFFSIFWFVCTLFQILGGGITSSQPASQPASQPSQPSHSSQIQVDVHVRGGNMGNEALCLEILGKFQKRTIL